MSEKIIDGERRTRALRPSEEKPGRDGTRYDPREWTRVEPRSRRPGSVAGPTDPDLRRARHG